MLGKCSCIDVTNELYGYSKNTPPFTFCQKCKGTGLVDFSDGFPFDFLDFLKDGRPIVKCDICGQKNRLAAGTKKLICGPLGPKCGRCKQPLAPL